MRTISYKNGMKKFIKLINIINIKYYFFSPLQFIKKKGVSVEHNNYSFINVSALIIIIFMNYKFYSGLKFDISLLSLIISFIISYLLSSFILNKFKFSNYKIISLLQKFILINIIIFIFIYFLL